jgi:hypothetical protein
VRRHTIRDERRYHHADFGVAGGKAAVTPHNPEHRGTFLLGPYDCADEVRRHTAFAVTTTNRQYQ